MVETITLALIDEFRLIPRQEYQRMLRFYVLRMFFFVQYFQLLSTGSIVAYQLCMILVTVQFDDINRLFIGCPTDVGKITVGRIACLQINGLFTTHVIYSYSDFVTCHPCHWIFVRLQCGNTGRSVDLRIIGYHGLIHAVESQIVSFRTPESTLHDAKLVAVYTLSVYDTGSGCVAVFVGADSQYRIDRLVAFLWSRNIQIVSYSISYAAIFLAEVKVGSPFIQVKAKSNLLSCKVIANHVVIMTENHFFTAGIRKRSRSEGTQRLELFCRFVLLKRIINFL